MHTVRPSRFPIYVEGLLGIGARQLIPLIQVKAHIGVRTMNKMHTIRKWRMYFVFCLDSGDMLTC